MDYRDERDALRARVAELEEKLVRAEQTIVALGGALRVPPEPAEPPEKLRTRGAVAGGAILIAIGVATLGVRIHRKASLPAPKAVQAPETSSLGPAFAAPRPPMFAAIEGKAAVDPIVWGTLEDKACLAAFSGTTGARIWRTCPYDPRAAADSRSTVVGNRLYVDFARSLDAFDVRTHEKLWSARLDERTFEHCPRADGTLRVSLEGGGDTYQVSPATGALSPAPRTYDCLARWDDWPWRNRRLPGQVVADKAVSPSTSVVEDMVVETTIQKDARTIVLGYARPGAHVPMAAALDEKGKVVWKRALPPKDPLLADAGGPWFAALDDRVLCAPYPAYEGYRLGCWEAATGHTVWNVRIEDPGAGFHGIALTEEHVILLYAGGFGMFDRETGALVHTIR